MPRLRRAALPAEGGAPGCRMVLGTACPADWDRRVLPGPGGPAGEAGRRPAARHLARGLLMTRHDPCHRHPDPAAPHPAPPNLGKHVASRPRAWLFGRDGRGGRPRDGQPGCGKRAGARAGWLGAGGICPGTARRDRAGWRRAADPCPVRSVPARSRGGQTRAERKASGRGRYGEAHGQAWQPGGPGRPQGRCRGDEPGPANAGRRRGFAASALAGSGGSGRGSGRPCRAAADGRGCVGGRRGWRGRGGRAGCGPDHILTGRTWACPSQRRAGTADGDGGGARRSGWRPGPGQRHGRDRRWCPVRRAGRGCIAPGRNGRGGAAAGRRRFRSRGARAGHAGHPGWGLQRARWPPRPAKSQAIPRPPANPAGSLAPTPQRAEAALACGPAKP